MSGPERLEVDRPPLGRRTGRVVLAVVLVVVGGLAVLRVSGSGPSPAPPPSGPSTSDRSSGPPGRSPPGEGWPTDLGLRPGTLYVLADDGVRTVDLARGSVGAATADVDPGSARLTPLSDGVLAWSRDGRRTVLLTRAGGHVRRPAGPLRSAAAVLPGPDGTVWVATGDARRSAPSTTWVRADEQRATGPRVRVPGTAVGDGAGGLLAVSGRSVRHVAPGEPRDVGPGTVLAVGVDGFVVNRCVSGTCASQLHRRSDDRVTTVRTAAPPNPQRPLSGTDPATLSPANRFLAETLVTDLGDQVRVSRVGPEPEVLRTFPGGGRRTALLWLSERWLVASSGDGLVLYDAAADTLLTPTLPLHAPTALALLPS